MVSNVIGPDTEPVLAPGKTHVENGEVRVESGHRIDQGGTIRFGSHFETGAAQRHRHRLPKRLIILNEQQSGRRHLHHSVSARRHQDAASMLPALGISNSKGFRA